MSTYDPTKKLYLRVFSIIVGAVIHSIALNFFMNIAEIIPGGFAGISLLLKRVFSDYAGINLPYSLLNISLNAIPAILGFFFLGRRFVFLSIVYILISSILIDLVPTVPLTDDFFLNVVFGGILYGFGTSLILNAHACSGGTDFIAMIISQKKNKSIWNYFLALNVVIYTVYGFLFGFQIALYSMIFQVINTAMINAKQKRYQRRTAFIVTKEAEPLAQELMDITGHGVTVIEAKGEFSGEARYILYMVISKKDLPVISKYIKENYQGVFLNITDSEELIGNFALEPIN